VKIFLSFIGLLQALCNGACLQVKQICVGLQTPAENFSFSWSPFNNQNLHSEVYWFNAGGEH